MEYQESRRIIGYSTYKVSSRELPQDFKNLIYSLILWMSIVQPSLCQQQALKTSHYTSKTNNKEDQTQTELTRSSGSMIYRSDYD